MSDHGIRWQPDGTSRHAHTEPDADDESTVTAICGHPVNIRRGLDEVEWLAPTCPRCERLAWQQVNPDLPYPPDFRGDQP